MLVKNLNIKLFQKKTNRRGWGHMFWPTPRNFQEFYLTPRNSRQNKVSPLETPQNCVTVHPSEILSSKTKTLGNSTLFLIKPICKCDKGKWESTYLLACLPDANKKIFCMSLPKCVLPFLTNQVAHFISCGDIGCFCFSGNTLLLPFLLPAWFQDSSQIKAREWVKSQRC